MTIPGPLVNDVRPATGPATTARTAAVCLLLLSATVNGCTRQPSPEACKAALIHMMEVQQDEMNSDEGRERLASVGIQFSKEQMQESTDWLKSQIPSLVTPALVDRCVENRTAADMQCTMSASTVKELIEKCHWKVVPGYRGPALGF